MRVHRRHEDRARLRFGRGHFRKRPRAERGPHPGFGEQRAQRVGRELAHGPVRVARKRNLSLRTVVRIDGDDDRPQRTLLAAMNRCDRSGGGCGERDAWRLPVLEQHAAAQNAIAGLHAQRRFEAEVIGSDEGYAGRVRRQLDPLRRCAGKRKIEASGERMHSHSVRRGARKRFAYMKPMTQPGSTESTIAAARQMKPADTASRR